MSAIRAGVLAFALLAAAPWSSAETPRWRIDLEGSHSDLTHGRESWHEAALRVSYAIDDGWTLGAAVETASRFNNFDAYVEARADLRFEGGTSFYVLAGGTPDADFRPRVALGAGGAQRLFASEGFVSAGVATLDLKYAEYLSGDVETVNPGLELYVAKGRAWLTARHINIWDETGRHRTGYFVRGDMQAGDDVTVFAGHADAPDTSDGVTVDTTSWFAGIGVDVATDTIVRLAVAQEMREQGYDRTTVTLSLTLKR